MKRFWSKVEKTDGCWNWTAAIRCAKDGYGAFWIGGKHAQAHRVAYELEHGPLPHGSIVAHWCDNPRCVRPSHLFVTDHAGNMADKVAKGRQARGERNGNAKLSDSAVERIREATLFGARSQDLAHIHGVHRDTVWRLNGS